MPVCHADVRRPKTGRPACRQRMPCRRRRLVQKATPAEALSIRFVHALESALLNKGGAVPAPRGHAASHRPGAVECNPARRKRGRVRRRSEGRVLGACRERAGARPVLELAAWDRHCRTDLALRHRPLVRQAPRELVAPSDLPCHKDTCHLASRHIARAKKTAFAYMQRRHGALARVLRPARGVSLSSLRQRTRPCTCVHCAETEGHGGHL